MDNFNLKKYLAEGRLLKEDIMVSPIIMFGGKDYTKGVIMSPDDYGFDSEDSEWVKDNILSAPKMISIQNYMDLENKWIEQAQIETGGGSDLESVVDGLKVHVKQGLITPEQEETAMKVIGLAEGKLYEQKSPKFKIGDFIQPIEGATWTIGSTSGNHSGKKFIGQIEDVYINKPENLEMKDGEYVYSIDKLNSRGKMKMSYEFKESDLESISDPTDYIKSLTPYKRRK